MRKGSRKGQGCKVKHKFPRIGVILGFKAAPKSRTYGKAARGNKSQRYNHSSTLKAGLKLKKK